MNDVALTYATVLIAFAIGLLLVLAAHMLAGGDE